jgi:hypothetical protein
MTRESRGHDPREQDFYEWLREKNEPDRDAPPPAPPPSMEPITTELGLFVGRVVRNEFLRGVAKICFKHGVEWEWDLERELLMRKVVLTLSGPGIHVVAAEHDIRSRGNRFADTGSGGG